MDLHGEIVVKDGRRPRVEIEIPEAEGTDDILTLGLKGRLTRGVADTLGINYLCCGDGAAPHDGFKAANLEISLVDMQLKLKGPNSELDMFLPEVINGFRVYRIGDSGMGIQCKATTNGRLQEILDFFRKHRGDGFEFSIKPRQGNLFEGGTRVEMSEGDTGEVVANAEPTGGPLTDIITAALEGIAAVSADPPEAPIPDPALDFIKGVGKEAYLAGTDAEGEPYYRLFEDGFFTGNHRVQKDGPLPEEYNLILKPADAPPDTAPPLAPRPRRQRRAVHGVEVPKPEPPVVEPKGDEGTDEPWAS